ncbi:carboxylesterase/lipase family protein [Planctomonas psychrotolerans]|uniref:carboxylesterase/lipase family protein n=1 Tax=Planctomonas psychrotolerans TaxID=2528712 RepID=UPI001D0CF629|nr:carboxylesterase/lipase family protein [Planctomonas psychrotolerans]
MTTTARSYRPSELDVTVTGGVVRGVRERAVEAWRGIPYAAPPTGERRFRAPEPVIPWKGARFAEQFGKVAPQSRSGVFLGADDGTPMGEDCLTINVLAPAGVAPVASAATRAAQLRPVMVFIHGGAYSVGSSRESPQQGEVLVREGGVLYVSFNYRLGALGYIDFRRYSTPERPIEANLGLRDQVAALRWVRENILAFGGDPDNVTLFGESAGGNAVTTLMTVPSAAGLFARAIAQSPPPNAVYPAELTMRWGEEFVATLARTVRGRRSAAEITPEAGAELITTTGWSTLVAVTNDIMLRTPDENPGTISLCPVIDGDVLPERPLDAFKAGRAARVPLIIGTNDREGSLFTRRLDILATTPDRIAAVFANTDEVGKDEIVAQYPKLPAKRAALDFGGDYSFWYPTVKVAERHSRFAPVHFYRFDVAPRLLKILGLDATHGLELYALFDRMDNWLGRGMTVLGGRRAFLAAGARMRRVWLSFARDGSVDESWPEYEEDTRSTLIFDSVDRVESDPRGDRRLAWQHFVPHV